MFNIVGTVNIVLAIGTIFSQIFILAIVAYLILPYKKAGISDFFQKNALFFSLMIALLSVAGSLFYSNYAGFPPCNLCWLQRIFMYPEVILLVWALIKKNGWVIDCSVALCIVGLLISLYNNYMNYTATPSAFCTAAAPCTTNYVLEFGYITIPMMALSAFILMSLFLIIEKYCGKNNN